MLGCDRHGDADLISTVVESRRRCDFVAHTSIKPPFSFCESCGQRYTCRDISKSLRVLLLGGEKGQMGQSSPQKHTRNSFRVTFQVAWLICGLLLIVPPLSAQSDGAATASATGSSTDLTMTQSGQPQ